MVDLLDRLLGMNTGARTANDQVLMLLVSMCVLRDVNHLSVVFWANAANDTVTGESWEYPEFRGFFGDLYWAVIGTRTQPITVVADTPGLYLRMLTPRAPKDPRFTAVAFPEGDISFMHAIPPIGTKFHAAPTTS